MSANESGGPGAARAVRGVVFDLDGVLVHTSDCHRDAYLEAFEAHGLGGIPFDYGRYAGWRTRDAVADVLLRAGVSAQVVRADDVARTKTAAALRRIAATNPIAPDADRVLAALWRAFALGLASSASRASVDAFLARNALRERFGAILSGDDVARAKPDPEVFTRAFAALGLAPGACLVVEDAVSGIAAARAAGARVIGITGTHPVSELVAAGACAVIECLAELPGGLAAHGAWPRALDLANWEAWAIPAATRERWTAVIPAAGRGTRLAWSGPKILYPVLGRTILEWLFRALEPTCAELVLVLAPHAREVVLRECERLAPGRFHVAVQPEPVGMGDAVLRGLECVRTPLAAVVWGDQVALRRSSIAACQRLHQGPLAPDVTVPIVARSQPYIHVARDDAGTITAILQRREGDDLPAEGMSDTGFFCVHAERTRAWLAELATSDEGRGRATGEFNFLPVIPWAVRRGARVLAPRIMAPDEAIGINTADEARSLEAFLKLDHDSR